MSLKIRIAKIEKKNREEEEKRRKNVNWLEKNNRLGWERAKVYSK